MSDVIFDFETLGLERTSCVVLSVGIFNFDIDRFIDNPYTFEEIYENASFYKFDVEEQVKQYNRQIEKGTLEWWASQDEEVRQAQMLPSPNDISITELKNIVPRHFENVKTIWTRGNTFDPIVMDYLLQQLGMPVLPYWRIKDTRSYIDALLYGTKLDNKFTPPGVSEDIAKHDPRVDIALDVLRIQFLIRELHDV